MSESAYFSNGTEFHDLFQPANCFKSGGCWHDRNEDCPIILDLINDHTSPRVVKAYAGFARCLDFKSMADGKREQREEEELRFKAEHLEQHGGGLFPEVFGNE